MSNNKYIDAHLTVSTELPEVPDEALDELSDLVFEWAESKDWSVFLTWSIKDEDKL